MMGFEIEIVFIVVLLCISATFSAAETALFSLNRREVMDFRKKKDRISKLIVAALRSPRNTLSTILLGNEVVNISISILVARIMAIAVGEESWARVTVYSVLFATPIILIFGDVLPKNIAVRNAVETISVTINFLDVFARVMSYPRRFLSFISDQLLRVFGGDPNVYKPMMMEEEFRQIIELGHDQGTIEDAELELIHGVFGLGDTTIDAIMTPIGDVFKLPLIKDIEDVLRDIKETQFSRIPVYDQNESDIVGVLHTRDLFCCFRRGLKGRIQDMEDIVRSAFFVNVKMTVEDLLRQFQKMKVHMGIVLGDKHKVIGIVTMDDVLEFVFRKGEDARVR